MAPALAGNGTNGRLLLEAPARTRQDPVPVALVGLALGAACASLATAVLVWLVFTRPLVIVDALNRWLSGWS